MTTLLDSRSRPSTEADRARAFAKPDPTEDETFTMASTNLECIGCGSPILPGHPAWIRAMPDDSSEVQFAKLDEDYNGEDVFAYHCWGCSLKHLGATVNDFAEERRQCAREERLEDAIAAEQREQLTPEHWYEIATANLGYCEPDEIKAAIDKLVADFGERYGANDTGLEHARTKLWSFVPMSSPAKGPVMVLLPEGEPKIQIAHLEEAGLAEITCRFRMRVAVR